MGQHRKRQATAQPNAAQPQSSYYTPPQTTVTQFSQALQQRENVDPHVIPSGGFHASDASQRTQAGSYWDVGQGSQQAGNSSTFPAQQNRAQSTAFYGMHYYGHSSTVTGAGTSDTLANKPMQWPSELSDNDFVYTASYNNSSLHSSHQKRSSKTKGRP